MTFTDAECRIFARRELVRVSTWAERHLIVPDGPYAGARYRKDVNPYLAPIMDAWALPEVEEILVCGAPQTGKTLCMYGCLCFAIAMRQGPRMVAMPDDDMMIKVVEAKLKPMFRKTKPIATLLQKIRSNRIDFSDTTKLYLSSAASPSQRATISVQDLFLDEEALFRQFVGQGVPVTDFKERTRSYSYKRKIMRISKPVGDESCSIWADLELMDEVRDFMCMCPACGTMQVLAEEHIITEHKVQDPVRVERERLGRYRCPHCKLHWSDYMRDQAVARGSWQARESVHAPRRIGYHLPAILSSAVSLSEIAATNLRLKLTDEADQHQAYANGMWARPYKPVIVKTSEDVVLQLCDKDLPARTVPEGYVAVTIAVDMQKRGFWYMVCAWTPRLDCTVIDYGRLKEWADVRAQVFDTSYPVQGSDDMAYVWRGALDTGGGKSENDFVSRTEEACDFITRYGDGVLHAVKGASHRQLNPVQWTLRERKPQSRTPIPGGMKLFLLDADYLKSWAASRMNPQSRQPLRLHRDCEESLAKQLTAEELVRERGKRVWKKKRKDNHYFDCLYMNMACVHASWTPSLTRLAGDMDEEPAAQTAAVSQAEARALPAEAPQSPASKPERASLW